MPDLPVLIGAATALACIFLAAALRPLALILSLTFLVLASLLAVDVAAGVLEISDFFSIAMMDPPQGF
jgi:hypothetical protein